MHANNAVTSCLIRRLFRFAHAKGMIEKNPKEIFFKEAKAAPLRQRSHAA